MRGDGSGLQATERELLCKERRAHLHFREEENKAKEAWQGIKAHFFSKTRLKEGSRSVGTLAGEN